MQILLVVNQNDHWPLNIEGVQIVTSRAYLSDPKFSVMRRVRVFNLCKSYSYQSVGYYVSLLAEATNVPRGAHATDSTVFRCPESINGVSPSSTSHTWIDLSSPAVTSLFPSLVKSKVVTLPTCPVNRLRSWLDSASQRTTFPSAPAVAIVLPLGAKDTSRMGAYPCPGKLFTSSPVVESQNLTKPSLPAVTKIRSFGENSIARTSPL